MSAAARDRAQRLLAEIKVRTMSADAIALMAHDWEHCQGPAEKRWASMVLEAARAKARQDFAAPRGWSVSRREFSLDSLKSGVMGKLRTAENYPVLDHLEYYVKDRRPAGIVTHGYCEWTDCVAFAELRGLGVEQLPFSWYRPHSCVAAVFTRKEGAA